MRVSAVISLAALAGSAAAIPLTQRATTTCQALTCLTKVEPVISGCVSAGMGEFADAAADMTCLKDLYSTFTAFPTECSGCVSAVMDGSLDLSSILSGLGLSSGSLGTIESIISELGGGATGGLSLPTGIASAITAVESGGLGAILTDLGL